MLTSTHANFKQKWPTRRAALLEPGGISNFYHSNKLESLNSNSLWEHKLLVSPWLCLMCSTHWDVWQPDGTNVPMYGRWLRHGSQNSAVCEHSELYNMILYTGRCYEHGHQVVKFSSFSWNFAIETVQKWGSPCTCGTWTHSNCSQSNIVVLQTVISTHSEPPQCKRRRPHSSPDWVIPVMMQKWDTVSVVTSVRK